MSVGSIIRKVREAHLEGSLWQRVIRTVQTALTDQRAPESPGLDLASWLDAAHASPHADLAGRRLVVFAYLPYWIDFMVPVSAALVARGADVTFAWLPHTEIDRDTPKAERELIDRYAAVLGQSRARFRSVDLATLAGPAPAEDTARHLERTAYLDTQYLRKREEIDVEQEDRSVYQFRVKRLRHTYGAMRRLIAEQKFDSLLLPSGGVLDFAAVWRAAHDAGLDNITIESWERLGTVAVGYGRPCFHEIATELWDADPKTLDPARRARVELTMSKRERPNWSGHAISYQTTVAGGAASLREELGLDERRPIALVCPNVPYDAAFLNIESGFATMADWLRTLVRAFEHRKDWQVVVRAHPGEKALKSQQSAESILRSVWPKLPEHIHFVAPSARVNTYALMRLANVGFVFGSTTGLEMSARGLPVVMPSATHYTGKGFTRDDFTRDGYLAAVQSELDAPRKRLSQAEVDLAWCYTDVYMNQWCRPFPWCWPTFYSDARTWPLDRVIGDEGMRRFGESFAILAGGESARERLSKPVIIEAGTQQVP